MKILIVGLSAQKDHHVQSSVRHGDVLIAFPLPQPIYHKLVKLPILDVQLHAQLLLHQLVWLIITILIQEMNVLVGLLVWFLIK